MGFKVSWKWARAILSAAGLLLFVYLVYRIGIGDVVRHISRFGPWFLLIVFLAALWLFLQSCSWYYVQNTFFSPMPLPALYKIKFISDALNTLLPSANIGGDAARALLMKKKKAVPLREGIPGVLFDKTLEFSAGTVFLMVGFLLGLLFLDLPRWLTPPALICLSGTVLGIGLLVTFQLKGAQRSLAFVSRLIPAARELIVNQGEKIKALDENLRLFYTKRNSKIFAAAGFHLLGRFLGVLEVFVILRVLGAQALFLQAFFMATFVTIVNTSLFIVPGQWGVQESAHVIIARGLGFPAEVGLSLSVIRRIRKLATIAIALVLFALEKRKKV